MIDYLGPALKYITDSSSYAIVVLLLFFVMIIIVIIVVFSDDKTASAITKKTESFYAKRDFEAELEDELSFTKGAMIEVVNKSISGWWTGR